MVLPQHDIVSIARSAAMAAPGSQVSIRRDDLTELCDELLSLRALMVRVGTDLRHIAQTAKEAGGRPGG